MEKLSTITRTSYKNAVDGYEIKYTATVRDGGNPDVSGTIMSGNARVGCVFRSKDGQIGLNMSHDIPNDTIKLLSDACIADTQAILDEVSGSVKSE